MIRLYRSATPQVYKDFELDLFSNYRPTNWNWTNMTVDIDSVTYNLNRIIVLNNETSLLSGFFGTRSETPAFTNVTSSGSVAAGKKSVTFITGSGFVGTIMSTTAKAGSTYTFNATEPSAFLPAMAYTLTGGDMEILTIE